MFSRFSSYSAKRALDLEKYWQPQGKGNLADLSAANVTFWELQVPSFLQSLMAHFHDLPVQGSASGLAKKRKLKTPLNSQCSCDTFVLMCNWHHVLPAFISHHWVYLDKIHSCCRKITAVNKKAWVTEINKRNYHHLYKGAPQELRSVSNAQSTELGARNPGL